jgi:hypothetical protein
VQAKQPDREQACLNWLLGKVGKPRLFWWNCRAFWYNVCKEWFVSFNLGRLTFGEVVWVVVGNACALVVVATPVILRNTLLKQTNAYGGQAVWWGISGALLMLQGLHKFSKRMQEKAEWARARGQARRQVWYRLGNCFGKFGELVDFKAQCSAETRQTVLEHLAICIREECQLQLPTEANHWQASIVVPTDATGKRAKVLARSEQPRQYEGFESEFDTQFTMARFATTLRKPVSVHDTTERANPFEFPPTKTEGRVFRSKVVFPILEFVSEPDPADATKRHQQCYCVGWVSVSSSRPFHFPTRHVTALEHALEPYMGFLRLTFNGSDTRYKVEVVQ